MKVLKFGGSSVAKPERIEKIVGILKSYYSKGEKFTVVFSAFGGVTDQLIEMSSLASEGDDSYLELFRAFSARHLQAARKLLEEKYLKTVIPELEHIHDTLKKLLYGIYLIREASDRTMDYLLSFGERNSAFIITFCLRQNGVDASFLDARRILRTNDKHGAAEVDFEITNENIKNHFNHHPEIQIVTGFIASSPEEHTTTLGRGGSDFTAAILAAALDAECIEIWTDVNGVLTADPRKVNKAFTIPAMTYAEAMEMSHFGAKVIYPPTLQPALDKEIPLYIKNTFNPDFTGTFITKSIDGNGHPIRGISSISEISLLTMQGSGMIGVPGIAGRLFSSLAQAGINIVLITQGSSEHSISFAVDPQNASLAKKTMEQAFEHEMQAGLINPVKVEMELSVIAIIGENMRYQTGVAGRLFQALGRNGINVIAIAQGSSELNISVVIEKGNETKALNTLHESFFLSDTKSLHLFIVGVGLIGGTLINQIKQKAAFLKDKLSIEIKIAGIANSKKMFFDTDGVDFDNWEALLKGSDQKMEVPVFIETMKALNLPNSIFIDNTASEIIPRHYENILNANISISTPNKIAASSSFLKYERLKNICKKKSVQYMYETNVGAGLPVISTLNDLINSGDEILKIEGVLSGSLSFIFNSFVEKTKFSEIVRRAGKLGYTEPDPRIDLNGIDVKRKILILAREVGYPLEPDDVKVDNILPKACRDADGVEAFFEALDKQDDYFEKLRSDAAKDGKVLRMIAKLENEKAGIGLQAVDSTNPFFNLSDSDNMIAITTKRYKDWPLVVRGKGAGAEVTAAGVFAEVIKIGSLI